MTSPNSQSKHKTPPQPPPLFTATPTSLVDETKKLIAESKALDDKLASEIKPEDATFANVMRPMANIGNEMALKTHILAFYQSVSTDQSLRDASTEAEKLLDDFDIETGMREDIFKLVDAVLNKKEKLDAESQRLLEKSRKAYIRNGLGLPAGPKRDRFKEIKKELSDIQIRFQKNLNEENGGLWFKTEELDGMPQDLIDGFQKGDGENKGKVLVTFKYPDLFPALKYSKTAATRKKLLIANENKSNQNVDLFKQAITLRDEAARLLGYKSHAEFRLEDKMAKTAKVVDDFLDDLRGKLSEGGLKEIDILRRMKEADLKNRGQQSEIDGHYYLWDHRYYDRLMLEKDYSVDQEKISEYFPLGPTIAGMLNIFEELFGLVFTELKGADRDAISETSKGSDIVWHEDVQVFSVFDDEGEGGEFVGYLYLDLHPRPGKYTHAANFNLQPGFLRENGTRRYPATALVCNFSKPSPKKPSLLKHEEVVTLFHELGHGIHDLVSRVTYSNFHGTSVVRDFVEAPSQMLENWCWTPSQLKSLSKHYSYLSPEYKKQYELIAGSDSKPEENIPDSLIENIVRSKHVNDALFNLRQLHFGTFDMAVHEPESHDAIEKLDASQLYNKMRKDISKLDGPEIDGSSMDEKWKWGHGEATFGHLIGGYDAGYYGYLYSQVYSTDMFYSVFKKDPMNGKEGRRYRHMVLEKGGSQEEMTTLEDFLGRKPNSEAFYKELGLA